MAEKEPENPAQKKQPEGEKKGADRGFGRGREHKDRKPRPKPQEEEWKPVTKLGRLVKGKHITSLLDVFRYAIPIKEHQIVDYLLGKINEDPMEVKSVQKQTQAGQRTRFKAFAIVGDKQQYIGLGWKCHKEVQGAIKGAVIMAKLNIAPVRRGYWGNKIGKIHTVPCKVTGKSGSVKVRLVPAPRGTGLVAPPVSKKVLQFAGIQDVYTKTEGKTRTRGNFIKACFEAIQKTYTYNNPDFWGNSKVEDHPFVKNHLHLSKLK